MLQQRYFLIVVAPLVLAFLILAAFPTLVREAAYATEKGKALAAHETLTDDQIKVATSLSTAFEKVAQVIEPSVVTVVSTQKASGMAHHAKRHSAPDQLNRQEQQMQRFFGNQFFKEFRFGPNLEDTPDFRNEMPRTGSGSGVIISTDGYILTNNHVIDGADEVTVKFEGGASHKAKIVGTDPKTDLAVLKIDATGLVAAKLGDSDHLEVGEWVLAVGNPFNLANTITAGIVSAKGRANVGIAEYEDFLQTDAAINPGNSGGPLVNLHGEVVGINTAIATNTGQYAGIGFAVPVNMAKTIKDSLIKSGHVQRGYLGVMIQDLNQDLAKSFKYDGKGVLIGDVPADGPGAKAGLKSGDILITYDGRPMSSVQELRNAVAATSPGQKVDLEVFRDGKTEKLSATIGELEGKVTVPEGHKESAKDLGMTLRTMTPEMARKIGVPEDTTGVAITEVDPDGLAAYAGLQPDQVITDVNGQPIRNLEQFGKEVKKHDVKDGLRLQVKSPKGSLFVFLKDQG
jgi:serine protease Do